MQARALYDKHRSAPVSVPRADITPNDLAAFCESEKFQFHAMGQPPSPGSAGWDDETVFRVATHEFPARGYTIALDTVAQWKRATAAIGPKVTEGGIYRHFMGEEVTTLCQASDAENTGDVIVYRDAAGRVWVRSFEDFFRVIRFKDELVPHFAWARGASAASLDAGHSGVASAVGGVQ